MLCECSVHTSVSDGLLMRMGPQKGYGKLTRAGCGGDALAERVITALAGRTIGIPVTAALRRDESGYLPLHINFTHIVPAVIQLPAPVRDALTRRYRKTVLCPLIDSVVTARVAKTNEKGTVLSIRQPYNEGGAANALMAVAPFERPPSPPMDAEDGPGDDTVLVRVLDYDVNAGALNVTMDPGPVGRGITLSSVTEDDTRWERGFRHIRAGSRVRGRVLLTHADDGLAVAEVVVVSGAQKGIKALDAQFSLLAFVVDLGVGASADGEGYAIGDELDLVLEYVPFCLDVSRMTPFVIASRYTAAREQTLLGPAFVPITTSSPTSSGSKALSGPLPWRQYEDNLGGKRARDRGVDESEGLRRREVEEAIDAFERETDVIPSTPEDFEKALMASPNSSFLWTQFIAYYLQLQQTEKARITAERALSHISIVERKEIRNVWLAYLNLENMYGTPESLATVFRRATEHSDDPLDLHEKMADIFRATKKPEQELAIVRTIAGKFRGERRAWERLGTVLLDQDKREQLKRMIKDMTSEVNRTIPPTDQILVLEHLAIHEYKSQRVESGRALFESLLLKAPRRSDVWQAYIDQEIAAFARHTRDSASHAANVQTVRNVFERGSTMRFSPRVMRQFLSRWLAFESEWGTTKGVEHVKACAQAYVASKLAGDNATKKEN